jgi:DNA replication ATP-dependent helicase Dna2
MAYAESGLVTASDVLNSRSWNTARHKAFGPYSPDRHLIVHPICERVEVHGPVRVREESIEEILGMLSQCRTDGFQAKDVLVITPFRDQARLIRKRLAHAGFREVTVSTVHRTQGSAKKVVIFDVVDGRHPFLQTDEAKRLLTVAFSRAEAKLLVLASQRDLAHPILQMAEGAANLEAVKLLAARGSNLSVNRPGYRGGPLG